MTKADRKRLEVWCMDAIKKSNEYCTIKDFSDSIKCAMDLKKKMVKKLLVSGGIEEISAALKVPVHIDIDKDLSYYPIIKSVTYKGVKFYEMQGVANAQR